MLQKGDVLIYDNYMLHRSGKNLTDTNRRALFSVFNAASDGDFHDAYYENEAQGRRKAGTKGLGGKANVSTYVQLLVHSLWPCPALRAALCF